MKLNAQVKARRKTFGYLREAGRVTSLLASTERKVMDSMEAKDAQYQPANALAAELARFVAMANVPIFSVDTKGRLLKWNKKAEELTGFSVDQVTGQLLTDWCENPWSVELVDGALRVAFEGGSANSVRVNFKTADGGAIRFYLNVFPTSDENGRIVGANLIAQDITELAAERDELDTVAARKTALLEGIFDLSVDAVVSIAGDGHIEYVNKAVETMMGIRISEAQGKPETWLKERLAEKLMPSELGSRLDSDEEKTSEFYLAKPSPMVLQRSVKIQRAPDGETLRKVMYFRDITAEKEVHRLKNDFLATAAHELRTPMASIYGFAELLMTREFDARTCKDIVSSIHRQTGVIVNLINDLLELSRIETRPDQPVAFKQQNIVDVVTRAVDALNREDDSREVIISIQSNLPQVVIDRERVVLAVSHMLGNAFKFSPLGGDVRLNLSSTQHKGQDCVRIEVVDEGIGMSGLELSRVFQRFYTAGKVSAVPGTGLGMSIVQEVAHLHKGDVTLSSEPGTGTSVSLYLPLP